jgi:predicted transcriptional regulator
MLQFVIRKLVMRDFTLSFYIIHPFMKNLERNPIIKTRGRVENNITCELYEENISDIQNYSNSFTSLISRI